MARSDWVEAFPFHPGPNDGLRLALVCDHCQRVHKLIPSMAVRPDWSGLELVYTIEATGTCDHCRPFLDKPIDMGQPAPAKRGPYRRTG